MSEPEKTETQAPAPQTAAPAPGEQPAPAVAASPPATAQPSKGPPQRGKKPQGSSFPRRRISGEVPSLEDQQRYAAGPKLKDLDDEIAGELEAALSGISEQELLGADSSKQARAQAAAAPAEAGRKQGRVISVHGKDVFIDVPGGRSQGVLPVEQFPDGPPAKGTLVEFSIEGYDQANGLLILTRRGAAVVADWSSIADGMVVEARVTATNKGGLEVDVNGIRGFMPVSQIDLYRVENPEQFVNQRLLCMVTDVNQAERNLVVSRRALLEKEREENRERLWQELAEGQVREGVVRSVREFGAFVDLGGVDGLVHVSEMSWSRVQDPTQILQPGQTVKVAVLKVDREKRKLSLGLKQLQPSPWDNIEQKYPLSHVVKARITKLMEFGAFAELEPGVEGLIPISELSPQRVRRVADIVQPGQEVQVLVLRVDPEQHKIALSLKAALAEEKEEEEETGEPEVPTKPIKPRTTPLRGGVGDSPFTFSMEEPEEE